MNITLFLTYHSQYGENLFITGDIPSLKDKKGNPLPLKYTEGGWKISFKTDSYEFSYSFFIQKDGNVISAEPANSHKFDQINKKYKNILLYDFYQPEPQISKVMQSAVFSNAIRKHSDGKKVKEVRLPIIFKTQTDKINFNHVLAVSGSDRLMGKWIESDMVQMEENEYAHFSCQLDANKIFFPLDYKYVIRDKKSESIVCWEKGCNHHIFPDFAISTDLIIINDRTPEFDIPEFKGAGTAVPVFSLRTRNSFGCGEFCDLKMLADWAAKTDQRIIQTLPINDTTVFGTWKDSYPYSAISVYALHPMYLRLSEVGNIKDKNKYKTIQKELNDKKFVDYELVLKYKWEFINQIYSSEKKKTFAKKEYTEFFEKNSDWLKPYAVFSFLRDKYHTSEFAKWGEDATCHPERIEQYCNPKNEDYDKIAIHFFVQFYLDKQLKEAVEYAHKKGVALKGDIPIGVNRNSVDVWQFPKLFDCSGSAGAPPDYFSKTGQVWGFPIYNWDEMAKNDYDWWKRRFQKMAEYYDAYRIDHILGFFRIFRVPNSSGIGLNGQFSPALPMTPDEIKAFNIPFNTKDFCEPRITGKMLDMIFGEQKNQIITTYLDSTDNDRYSLKPFVNTPEKINRLPEKDESDKKIKERLLHLSCQVFFVEDYKEKGKYHPRIALYQSYVFQTVDRELQDNINRIYEYFYYQRHNEFWRKESLKKLPPLVKSTNMMVCGEDLGMVPQCVPSVMRELEILSLEIQRMPKEAYVEFGNLNRVPRYSVSTTTTHDMSTMRAWWEEDRSSIQRYFNNELHQYGDAPQFCEPWICQQIIENHLQSQALWVILPIQDWMATDGNVRWKETFSERINDPSNPDNYWRYRMHINLEDLIENREFNQLIKNLIKQGGR